MPTTPLRENLMQFCDTATEKVQIAKHRIIAALLVF